MNLIRALHLETTEAINKLELDLNILSLKLRTSYEVGFTSEFIEMMDKLMNKIKSIEAEEKNAVAPSSEEEFSFVREALISERTDYIMNALNEYLEEVKVPSNYVSIPEPIDILLFVDGVLFRSLHKVLAIQGYSPQSVGIVLPGIVQNV